MSTTAFEITLVEHPRQKFTQFYALVVSEFGSECCGALDNGLLGYLVNDTLWATLPNNLIDDGAGNLIARPRPTIHLVTPTLQNAATSAAAQKWKVKMDNRKQVIDTLLRLKNKLIASLGPSDQAMLSHPIFGMMNVTPRQIMDHLIATYGHLDSSDLLRLDQDLLIKMTSAEVFETVSSKHKIIHDKLAFAGQPLSEHLKCRKLKEATYHVPSIKMAIDSYHTARPLVANQTFITLVAHITEQAPNFIPSSSDLLYHTSPSFDTATNIAYQAILARLDSLSIPSPSSSGTSSSSTAAAAMATPTQQPPAPPSRRGRGDRRRTSGRGGRGGTTPASPARVYCYLHGYDGNHSGAYCLTMLRNVTLYTADKRVATTHNEVIGGSTFNM
jgi:hypothetical protein